MTRIVTWLAIVFLASVTGSTVTVAQPNLNDLLRLGTQILNNHAPFPPVPPETQVRSPALQLAGPSFDCRKVTKAAEGAVCASPELAALDRQVADAYGNAVATADTSVAPAGRPFDGRQGPSTGKSIGSGQAQAEGPALVSDAHAESEKYYKDCEAKKADGNPYPYFHDCRCLATSFEKERLKRGPDVSPYTINTDIGASCVNKPGIILYGHDDCTRNAVVYERMYGVKPDQLEGFCTCVGSTMAVRYAAKPDPDYQYIGMVQAQAGLDCSKKAF